MNETLRLIAARRSHRAYETTPLTAEQLECLLDAALASPSARNLQPWHFTVVRNQQLLAEMNAAAREAAMEQAPEKRSARFQESSFDIFYHAPTVIFLSGVRANRYSHIDCGIAVQNIALAAESMGLGSVILGLPNLAFESARGPEFRQALEMPEDSDFVIAIAVGVPADDKGPHPVSEGKISFVD